MFNLTGEKARSKKQRYKMGKRLPIETANALLAHRRYQYYTEQVQGLCALPSEHFDDFYQNVIQRFAEFVQHLPDGANEYLSSLLTNSLLRGLNTLSIFVTEFDNPSPLERFALFTAALLQNISQVLTQQKIFITDSEGNTLRVWQPFCGPMTEEFEGNSYKIIPLASIYERIDKSIKVTLARQILGENGFLWIASDLRIFMEWLEALINEDGEGTGRLINVIRRYRRDGGGLLDALPQIDIELLDSPATEYGDAFHQWLVDGLQDGTIKTNSADAHAHMTELGLFIETPAIFKDFCDLHQNIPVNQFVVFTQFGNLIGIASKGGGDYLHTQLFSSYPDGRNANFGMGLASKSYAQKDGILIADTKSLFQNAKEPPATPHIKIPAEMKKSFAAIAGHNEAVRASHSIKNT